MNLILLLLAFFLFCVLAPLGFWYTIIICLCKGQFKYLSYRFWKMALTFDQSGNVFCADMFNAILITTGHKFGDEDETISSVLGKNKRTGTLTFLGKGLSWTLNQIDRNHVEIAIEEDEG